MSETCEVSKRKYPKSARLCARMPTSRADSHRRRRLGPHFILDQARTASAIRSCQTLGFTEHPLWTGLRLRRMV